MDKHLHYFPATFNFVSSRGKTAAITGQSGNCEFKPDYSIRLVGKEAVREYYAKSAEKPEYFLLRNTRTGVEVRVNAVRDLNCK